MENNLSFLMTKHDIGPTELSEKVGVSRNTIQRILRKKNASAETMFKIAQYFDMEIGDIFFVKSVLQIVHDKKTA